VKNLRKEKQMKRDMEKADWAVRKKEQAQRFQDMKTRMQ